MARLIEFSKDEIIEKSFEFIKKNGIKRLTARNLSKFIGCSTQPIYKNFTSMNNLIDETKVCIKKFYNKFIHSLNNNHTFLYMINYSYTLFALEEPYLFEALFMSDINELKTIDDVVKCDNELEILNSIHSEYNLSKKQSERLYRDVKIYTHGLSCQIVYNCLSLKREDLSILIKNIINNLRKEI